MVGVADVNAGSRWWLEETDERGEAVEEVLLRRNMEITNKTSELKTFEDRRGRGRNIDIIAVTEDIYSIRWEWRIEDKLMSDHRALILEVKENRRGREDENRNIMRKKQYNWRTAQWGEMHKELTREVAEENWNEEEADKLVEKCYEEGHR